MRLTPLLERSQAVACKVTQVSRNATKAISRAWNGQPGFRGRENDPAYRLPGGVRHRKAETNHVAYRRLASTNLLNEVR